MTGNDATPTDNQDEHSKGTRQDAAAERLIQQVGRFVHLLNITHEALVCVDEQCRVAVFNQGAEKMFGYQADEVIGTQVSELLCRRYRTEEKHRLTALTRIARESGMGFKTDKVICKRKSGERFPCEVSLSHSDLPGHRLYTLIVNDITQRRNQERQLTYRAEHDQLTDLPNRALLSERLSASIARADRYGRKLGVVYLDLNQFKPINDNYGHETGDCLLQAVAKRLSDTMRQTDTVSRIGGDEFIVCLEQIKSEQDAVAATHKIVDTLRLPFQILGQALTVSASIGIAIYPNHGKDPNTLLRHADQAMYRAKAGGCSPELYHIQNY